MEQCDIAQWVSRASDDHQRELRQAVHIVLRAIAGSVDLQPKMVMKGAMLLALRYDSTRYTRDIDFSTEDLYGAFNPEMFRKQFEQRVALAVEELPYDLDCRLQSWEVKPKRVDASFPTLTVGIGHAYKNTPKHKRLLGKQCPSILSIDYSFNELTEEVEMLRLDDGTTIQAYSFIDLIAEKLRTIVQQEVRNRSRRQDAYDLYRLFQGHPVTHRNQKQLILDGLRKKAAARDLILDQHSLARKEIMDRSRKDYPLLQQEIEETLPPFETVYGTVQTFYESLPWGHSQ